MSMEQARPLSRWRMDQLLDETLQLQTYQKAQIYITQIQELTHVLHWAIRLEQQPT